jgi:hypothetical protein
MSGVVRMLRPDDPRAAVRPDDEFGPSCPHCGGEMGWERCETCGGEGGRSPYEDDPLQYLPDDWDECDICDGHGGWWACANSRAWCEANPRPGAGRAPTTAG